MSRCWRRAAGSVSEVVSSGRDGLRRGRARRARTVRRSGREARPQVCSRGREPGFSVSAMVDGYEAAYLACRSAAMSVDSAS